MKLGRNIIFWLLLGAVYGTATGIISRQLGLGPLTGGLLGGIIAAPALVIILLLAGYWEALITWALGGALIGVAAFTLMEFLANRALSPLDQAVDLTGATILNRALIGAVLSTWLGAGSVVFKRGGFGVILLLVSMILGGPMGVMAWLLGDLIGGDSASLHLLGTVYTWRWGETLAGVLVGLLAGYLVTQLLFRSDFVNIGRKRTG